MIWAKTLPGDSLLRESGRWLTALRGGAPSPTEQRLVRDYLLGEPCSSETALSLASKLGLNQQHCRRALDHLVDDGLVRRRDFVDMESIYYRYPATAAIR